MRTHSRPCVLYVPRSERPDGQFALLSSVTRSRSLGRKQAVAPAPTLQLHGDGLHPKHVACDGHGTASRVLPRAWDHPVASDGTTRRAGFGVLITSGTPVPSSRSALGGFWGWHSGRWPLQQDPLGAEARAMRPSAEAGA